MKTLVTGAAGFIGFHTCASLLKEGVEVVGFDNLNDYYDVTLKSARLNKLQEISDSYKASFSFIKGSLENELELQNAFSGFTPNNVINLAAQAGVRHSLTNPQQYIKSNILGFCNLLEACKDYHIENLLYASSSSVYGGNQKMPFSEKDNVSHPLNIYAASKRSNELMAHSYSHLYGIPTTGMRFFTVYGPWGRPDMALFLFVKAIQEGRKIQLFNKGDMTRGFTYIDDVVSSILRLLKKPACPSGSIREKIYFPNESWSPFRIFNIGNPVSVPLTTYLSAIEKSLGKKAYIEELPMQPGDAEGSVADTGSLDNWIGFKPETSIEVGIDKFVNWYKEFYG